MEQKVNICAVQLCAEIGNKYKNFEKVSAILDGLKNTDVIVLPEVWNIGWNCALFRDSAENLNDSETVNFLKELAISKNSNVIGGSLITKDTDGRYFNTCPVIDRNGNLLKIYNKNHLYSYYGSFEGKIITRGSNPVMVELDGVKYGLTICYDIRFPEIYRAYRKSYADILVNCAAWANTKPVQWEVMTKSRAVENQTYMIAVNQFGYMGNDEYNLGHSRIIDYNGGVLSEILDGEGFIQHEINLNEMYEFRNMCNILSDIKEGYEVI